MNRPQHPEPAATGSAREQLLAGLPVAERRIDAAGISTAVLEGGSGPPVVLLHGPLGNVAHWMDVIPGLIRTHRLVVPDLPGHGASIVSQGPLDRQRVLDWLEELIEATCPSPPALVGHLLSGAIAARFAVEATARVSRLVLVNTFGLRPLQLAPEFAAALHRFLEQATAETHDEIWRLCARDLDGLRARLRARWQPFAAYNLERAQTPETRAAVEDLMKEFGIPAIPAELWERIAVPTTLVWGRHDSTTPLAIAKTASRRYGWPLHVIENVNDDPPVEQPEALVRALRTALRAA